MTLSNSIQNSNKTNSLHSDSDSMPPPPMSPPQSRRRSALIPAGSPGRSKLPDSPASGSLNHFISSSPSIKEAHAAYMKKFREENKVAFNFDTGVDYGYGDAQPDDPSDVPKQQQMNKKRRFERRCSKTPAMLRAMSSPIMQMSLFDEKASGMKKSRSTSYMSKANDDWDDGLEIAEELVKHLQNKRRISQI